MTSRDVVKLFALILTFGLVLLLFAVLADLTPVSIVLLFSSCSVIVAMVVSRGVRGTTNSSEN